MLTKTDPDQPRRSAYAVALALLARREHSRQQLIRKLALREYAQDEITAALDQLSSDGYLNDQRASQATIASGLRRGHGPARIRAGLRQAGLPSDQAISGDDACEIDWVKEASALAERRFGSEPPADYPEWARRARFLQARGYDSETIHRALRAAP